MFWFLEIYIAYNIITQNNIIVFICLQTEGGSDGQWSACCGNSPHKRWVIQVRESSNMRIEYLFSTSLCGESILRGERKFKPGGCFTKSYINRKTGADPEFLNRGGTKDTCNPRKVPYAYGRGVHAGALEAQGFLAHLSRRLEWAIAVRFRPSSVVRKLFTFSSSSWKRMVGF